MSEALTLNLPWPPSVNAVWRSVTRGRFATVYKTKAGKDYTSRVGEILLLMGRPTLGEARLSVIVEAYPPDRRARDLDNISKVLLDSLQAAQVFNNDAQIDDLRIVRRSVEPPGGVTVHLKLLEKDIHGS